MAATSTIQAWLAKRALRSDLNQTGAGQVLDAMAADALWPGMVTQSGYDGAGGFTTLMGGGRDAWTLVKDWLETRGFRASYPVMTEQTILASRPPAWIAQGTAVGGAEDFSNQARGALTNLYNTRLWPLGIVDKETQQGVIKLLGVGVLVVPVSSVPSWATNAITVSVWDDIASQARPIMQVFNSANMAQAASQAEALAANAAFWDRVYRATAAVATMGLSELLPLVKEKWDELVSKMKEYNSTKKNALAIASDPKTDSLRAKTLRDAVEQQDGLILGKIATAFGSNPEMQTLVKQEGGMGALGPVALFASLSTAAQLAIIAAIVAVVIYAIVQLNNLGVFALMSSIGDAVKWMSGPVLGFVALAGIGFWAWKKYGKKG